MNPSYTNVSPAEILKSLNIKPQNQFAQYVFDNDNNFHDHLAQAKPNIVRQPNRHNQPNLQNPIQLNLVNQPNLLNRFGQQPNHVNNNLIKLTNQPKNREQFFLENFIYQLPNTLSISLFYCNACCVEIVPAHVAHHIQMDKHVNAHKRLNNQLLAVNLFQISKHYDQQLTDFLTKNYNKNFKTIKPNKISGKFAIFYFKNLKL